MKHVKIYMIILLFTNASTAQINMTYSIGCIGNTNSKDAVFSGVVLISGKSCFLLSNGISIFLNGKTGLFNGYCDVVTNSNNPISILQVKAFPNPFTDYVIIQTVSRFTVMRTWYITIYNTNGQQLKTLKATTQELNDGIRLKMTGFAQGVYYARINSPQMHAELKLIKAEQY
ncbi:MAG: T9SS type A sorting domain-containing protein [Sediminibacterium sp.]